MTTRKWSEIRRAKGAPDQAIDDPGPDQTVGDRVPELYAELARRMIVAAGVVDSLSARTRWPSTPRLVHAATLWSIGLSRLHSSSGGAAQAMRDWNAEWPVVPKGVPFPTASQPKLVTLERAAQVEEFDLLAVFGLGELLREATAAVELELRAWPSPARIPGQRQPSLWDAYMKLLDRSVPDQAGRQAIEVDVRLRATANLIVSHPSGRAGGWQRDAAGMLYRYGHGHTTKEEQDAGTATLKRLNASLPRGKQSSEANARQLAHGLIGIATSFNLRQRLDLAIAMRDIGLEVEVREALTAVTEMVVEVASEVARQLDASKGPTESR